MSKITFHLFRDVTAEVTSFREEGGPSDRDFGRGLETCHYRKQNVTQSLVMVQRRALLNMVMDICAPWKAGNFLLTWVSVSFSHGIGYLVSWLGTW